jgi:hypothetical protein
MVTLGLIPVGLTLASSRPLAGASVALVGGLAYIALIVVHLRRGQRHFDAVRAAVAEPKHWALPRRPDPDGDGSDPFEDTRLTGRWGEARIWVALVKDWAVLRVALDRWPADLGIRAASGRRAPGTAVTGDDAFDDRVVLDGVESEWRPLVTADVRRLLTALLAERAGSYDPATRVLEVLLPDSESSELQPVLDQMAALAAALPESAALGAHAGRIRDEPLAAVRRGHYAHLIDRGWDVPSVLRAAAADPDPAIAAWAASQLPPSDGVYR